MLHKAINLLFNYKIRSIDEEIINHKNNIKKNKCKLMRIFAVFMQHNDTFLP